MNTLNKGKVLTGKEKQSRYRFNVMNRLNGLESLLRGFRCMFCQTVVPNISGVDVVVNSSLTVRSCNVCESTIYKYRQLEVRS